MDINICIWMDKNTLDNREIPQQTTAMYDFQQSTDWIFILGQVNQFHSQL